MAKSTLHGWSIELPEGASDQSTYRFVLPTSNAERPALLTGRPHHGPEFRPSLIVAQHPEAMGSPPEELLLRSLQAAKARAPGLQSQRSGACTYRDAPLVWQDRTFAGPNGLRLFQRVMIWAPAGAAPVVATLTASSV